MKEIYLFRASQNFNELVLSIKHFIGNENSCYIKKL